MLNLNDLKIARKNVAEKRSGNADTAYSEGVKMLELYKIKPSIARLEQAGKKFIEAIEYNNEHVSSLVYISFVLYALGNEEMAMKYMKMAEKLLPGLNNDLNRFKVSIEKSIEKRFNLK